MTDISAISLNSGFIRAELSNDGGTWLLTLDRPAVKNALSLAMYADLAALLNGFAGNENARVVIIRGAGGCFTSGNDLGDFASAGIDGVVNEQSNLWRFMVALRDCPKPVVMAVDGVAIGIGTTMLLHADAVFASPSASFAMPFTKLGLCPEYASSLLLPRRVGYLKAAEWLMLGTAFDADQAKAGQLINDVVDNALAAAQEHALKLQSMPVNALQTTKALLKSADKATVDQCMLTEAEYFKAGLRGKEFAAAVAAFFGKR
ncbi:MAG TPA: enoyl-CoA hydratase-related protein [Marinagarivorans sp.]